MIVSPFLLQGIIPKVLLLLPSLLFLELPGTGIVTGCRIGRILSGRKGNTPLAFEYEFETIQLLLVIDHTDAKLIEPAVAVTQLSLAPGTLLNRAAQNMELACSDAAGHANTG